VTAWSAWALRWGNGVSLDLGVYGLTASVSASTMPRNVGALTGASRPHAEVCTSAAEYLDNVRRHGASPPFQRRQ
jgi:hypothetical protein